MILLNDVLLLYKQRDRYNYDQFLKKLCPFVNQLQYCDDDIITNICKYLRDGISDYARINSPIYHATTSFISKEQLTNPNEWYNERVAYANAITSGTTGTPFKYRRWSETYYEIENNQHYGAILNEFKLRKPISLLYLMLDKESADNQQLITKHNTDDVLISHGNGRQTTVHEVIRNKTFYTDYQKFYEKILDYTNKHDIDIILAPGNVIAALTWNVKRLKHKNKICKLLSNTGDKVDHDDLNYLYNNQCIDNWCDHMRCWDGGVTFYTCRYHTYHLLDGLSWASSDTNDRLISSDYFSLPAPFVNYWNGDHAKIETSYSRCKCGRAYRPFTMLTTRAIGLASTNNSVLKTILSPFEKTIKRVEGSGSFTRVFTTEPLPTTTRHEIRQQLPKLTINFVTEEPYD